MSRNPGTGVWRPNWRGIGLGTGAGMITMLTVTGAGAWLLERQLLGMEWMNYLAAAILLVSAFLAAKTAGASLERWMDALLTGAGMWMLLALIHGLGYDGALTGAGVTALIIAGGTGAAVLLSRGGGRRGSGRRKHRNR